MSRRMDLLDLLATNDRWLGGEEVAALLESPLHTARRVIGELVREGYVNRQHTVRTGTKTVMYRINVRGLLLVSELRKVRGALR